MISSVCLNLFKKISVKLWFIFPTIKLTCRTHILGELSSLRSIFQCIVKGLKKITCNRGLHDNIKFESHRRLKQVLELRKKVAQYLLVIGMDESLI